MRGAWRTLAPIALWAVAACDLSDPSEGPDAPLRTDRDLYEVRRVEGGLAVDIPFEYTNGTGGEVRVVHCEGESEIVLEQLGPDGWVRAWSPVLPACVSPPLVIASGESTVDTLSVFAADPGCSCGAPLEVEGIEGEHRLVWEALIRPPFGGGEGGNPLHTAEKISNRFRLRLAAP